MNQPLHTQPLAEISQRIRAQTLSPVTVLHACLDRIATLNPIVNAFITVTTEQALADAQQAEADIKAGHWRGPLHGIPVAFKDMYDTAGIKTTAAFEHFKNRVPAKDAAAVHKLKAAGAIVVGKTNMHKLAMGTTSLDSYFGPVHNPWNPDYIAGGSSGGSAAAVALGMCHASVDTDAIGSCRLPAACCAVTGYKCTWGLLDNSGILEGEPADAVILKLATVGLMTRSITDTALLADALAGTAYAQALHPLDSATRIAVVTNFGATPAIRRIFNQATAVFQKLGCRMAETSVPFSENPDMAQMDAARKTVAQDLFSTADALLLPTTAAEVPTAQAAAGQAQALSARNTFFANYYGLPAISVPCGFDDAGLPVGLQIVGKPGGDGSVLQIAQAFQNATTWHLRQPTPQSGSSRHGHAHTVS